VLTSEGRTFDGRFQDAFYAC